MRADARDWQLRGSICALSRERDNAMRGRFKERLRDAIAMRERVNQRSVVERKVNVFGRVLFNPF